MSNVIFELEKCFFFWKRKKRSLTAPQFPNLNYRAALCFSLSLSPKTARFRSEISFEFSNPPKFYNPPPNFNGISFYNNLTKRLILEPATGMSSFVSRENDPKAQYFYSRKEKSLGLLCTKYSLHPYLSASRSCQYFPHDDFSCSFLSLYDREDVESIGLDDAASRLGQVLP